MKSIPYVIILAAIPLLMAALWMDKQPSHKAYQAPLMTAPAGSVPVTGKELVSRESEPKNPLVATAALLERGKALFAINCAMCHGHTSTVLGPVGKKLDPAPPGLERELLQARSDAHIFKVITFGFGRMPPFKEKLTPQERWELVIFLRTRK